VGRALYAHLHGGAVPSWERRTEKRSADRPDVQNEDRPEDRNEQ